MFGRTLGRAGRREVRAPLCEHAYHETRGRSVQVRRLYTAHATERMRSARTARSTRRRSRRSGRAAGRALRGCAMR
eukprot:353183-Chlamydomonas_euryale.AAC.12